ncbi:MAG: tetratricopeptide repeat protein [Burkholderiales bacterium]|nr:tetratricopeptide repeat protein [Burkholderiales bacterium]
MRRLLILLLATALSACTPQQALLSALVPDGTASVLLGHLQGVEDGNRRRIVELEQRGAWSELAAFADANIGRDPFSPEWRMIGGYAQARQGEHRRAATYFAEMVRLAPDDPAGYHFLAEAQRAAGQPLLALKTLDRALLVLRDSPLTHHLAGETNSDLGRFREAAGAYRRALRDAPGFADAWFGLGRAALELGRESEAREALAALEQLKSPLAAALGAQLAKPR